MSKQEVQNHLLDGAECVAEEVLDAGCRQSADGTMTVHLPSGEVYRVTVQKVRK
jgi:hypothetical protein